MTWAISCQCPLMIAAELVGDRAVEEVIRRLFKIPEVRYLHARTASLGCYIMGLNERKGSLTYSYIYIRGEFGTMKDPGQCA